MRGRRTNLARIKRATIMTYRYTVNGLDKSVNDEICSASTFNTPSKVKWRLCYSSSFRMAFANHRSHSGLEIIKFFTNDSAVFSTQTICRASNRAHCNGVDGDSTDSQNRSKQHGNHFLPPRDFLAFGSSMIFTSWTSPVVIRSSSLVYLWK